VLDPDTGKLIGTLRQKDVLAAYDKEVFHHGGQQGLEYLKRETTQTGK